jgi:uncharacterized membrane protein YhaH (DUF805 family)
MGLHTYVHGTDKEIVGIWFQDPADANPEMIATAVERAYQHGNGRKSINEHRSGYDNHDDSYISNHRIVPNNFDHNGGCFVMFGSTLAPGEKAVSSAQPPSEVTDMTLAHIYFSFNGRIDLATYWLKGVLPILAFTIIINLIDVAYFDYSGYSGVPTLLGFLLVIWPSLALSVKRWHDRDKSGWWVLIGIIPYIGIIWAFIENGLLPGTKGPNHYGVKSF